MNRVLTNKIELARYKRSHPCVRCGESNPVLIDLHHIDSTTKGDMAKRNRRGISGMLFHASPLEMISEIAKCESLCVRCHRLETAKQQNWPTLESLESCSPQNGQNDT